MRDQPVPLYPIRLSQRDFDDPELATRLKDAVSAWGRRMHERGDLSVEDMGRLIELVQFQLRELTEWGPWPQTIWSPCKLPVAV